MITHQKKTVLIVGAGPVGMVLASQLKRFGVSVRIIEKRPDFMQGSKALSINPASLKIFDSMGLIDTILEKGKKVRHVNVHWNNRRFLHMDYAYLQHCPYQYYVTLPQPETEKILAAHLLDLGVTIERHLSLKSLYHLNDASEAELVHSNGLTEMGRYAYIVGCDGSKSTVRRLLQRKFIGHDYHMYFLLIDVLLEWGGPKEETHYYIKNDGFIIVIPLPEGLHRIVIKENGAGLNNKDYSRSIQDYQTIVDYYGPGNIRLKSITWESSAPFYNRLVDKYRDRNIFLAGDAAHLFSPIGGLGMNTGLQDVYNLAWKLAGVIHGDFKPDILDTYEEERLAMAKHLIQATDETTRLVTRLDTNANGRLQYWMPAMKNRKRMRKEWPLNFSGLGQKYMMSSLKCGNLISEVMIPRQCLGGHTPHAQCLDSQGVSFSTYHLHEKYYPTILIFSDDHSVDLVNFFCEINPYGCPLILVSSFNVFQKNISQLLLDKEQVYRRAFDAKEGDVFLLRPDGYVGYCSHFSQVKQLKQCLDSFFALARKK